MSSSPLTNRSFAVVTPPIYRSLTIAHITTVTDPWCLYSSLGSVQRRLASVQLLLHVGQPHNLLINFILDTHVNNCFSCGSQLAAAQSMLTMWLDIRLCWPWTGCQTLRGRVWLVYRSQPSERMQLSTFFTPICYKRVYFACSAKFALDQYYC